MTLVDLKVYQIYKEEEDYDCRGKIEWEEVPLNIFFLTKESAEEYLSGKGCRFRYREKEITLDRDEWE